MCRTCIFLNHFREGNERSAIPKCTMNHYKSLKALMTHYDPLWATMTHYDPLWIITMSHYEPLWPTVNHYYETLWPTMSHYYDPLWDIMSHYELMWATLSYYMMMDLSAIIIQTVLEARKILTSCILRMLEK